MTLKSPCRVWKTYQARCISCLWSGDMYGDDQGSRELAAEQAAEHRRTPEHVAMLKESRSRRPRNRRRKPATG